MFDNREPAICFVDGPGGSGKSFLFVAFLHYVRGRGEIAAACAWCLAATLLPGGRTRHARFGFSVPLPREDVPWSVIAATGRGQVLIQSCAVVWDEVGTASAAALDAADACLRELRPCDEPFGGALVGEGRVPYDMDVGPCSSALPPPMSLPAVAQPEDLIQFVCDDILPETRACLEVPNNDNIRRLASRCILTPRNDWATQLNESVLSKFLMVRSWTCRGLRNFPGLRPRIWHLTRPSTSNTSGSAAVDFKTLRLCPGALVMLLRNLDYEDGFCNGTRCLVIAMSPRALDVLVLTGTGKGKRAFLP
eukprot:s675_g12.t2